MSDPRQPTALGEAFIAHADFVQRLAFDPSGMILASSACSQRNDQSRCIQSETRLWDVSNRAAPQPIGGPYPGHAGAANDLIFVLGGQYAASAGCIQNQDSCLSGVILWPAAPSAWMRGACRRAGRNLTQEEWKQYLGEEPYRKTCDNWPEGK